MKHLPFSQLSTHQQEVVTKLSAILRVADGLDYARQARVRKVECSWPDRKTLTIKIVGKGDFSNEMRAANEKVELMNEVFGVKTVFG